MQLFFSYIVEFAIPMALRCQFDWWLIESLRYLHTQMKDHPLLNFCENDDYRQDCYLDSQRNPLMITIPAHKFAIFLDFFVAVVLDQLGTDNLTESEQMHPDFAVLCRRIIKPRYLDLGSDFIEAIKRIKMLISGKENISENM